MASCSGLISLTDRDTTQASDSQHVFIGRATLDFTRPQRLGMAQMLLDRLLDRFSLDQLDRIDLLIWTLSLIIGCAAVMMILTR